MPLVRRFSFSPVLADFVMGFADMNKWFVAYPQPANGFERSITEHAREDQTHSRLFVDEWAKLGLDDQLGWSAGDTLWWWFWCRETEVIRRSAMETLALAEHNQDPLVRFALVEAIEICGDVFFSNTCPLAEALQQQTGLRYDYFGVYHREREDGHLRCDEQDFVDAQLSESQWAEAETAMTRIFDMFIEELDQLLDYAKRISANPRAVAAALKVERAGQLERVTASGGSTQACTPAPVNDISQGIVAQEFAARMGQLREHPLVEALGRGSPGAAGAVELLRNVVPLWAIDVLGYRDFQLHVLSYRGSLSAPQRAINRWAARLASHGVLYLRDWDALSIDQTLAFSARETIEHYFLGEYSEVHRHAMALAKKRAFASEAPALRYWLMRALEDGGDVLFDALAPSVQQAEQELGAALPYWGRQHAMMHPVLPADPEADAVAFEGLVMDADERDSALLTIRTIFDNLQRQFDLSLLVAEPLLLPTCAPLDVG